MVIVQVLFRAVLACAALLLVQGAALAEASHAIAMHGEPALPADFTHFRYVNPDAPKGGKIDYAVPGTFDSVNPFIVQGSAARGILDLQLGYNVYDSLMQRSYDEPFTLYPLVAKSVETDDDRSFVEFTIDERARFSDGVPVTPEDVIFTVKLLGEKGYPRYATTLNKIAKMEKVGAHGVRFTFKRPDRELPLILGLMPVLPEHATDAANFDKSTLKPMIGSGPYVIAQVRPGEAVVLKRNPDYWAKNLPSKIGFDNFDEIRINYFRDENAMFQAFRKGIIDVRIEGDPIRWKSEYDFPAARDGRIVRDTFKTGLPSGMLGFVMNTRRPVFRNRQVRAALAGLFDFEWANRNLFADAYERTKSYFDGSELSSAGIAASPAERALLSAYPQAVTPAIMEGKWAPPVSDGSGRDRAFLKNGYDALEKAGYAIEGHRMVGPDGRPLAFEILLNGSQGEPAALVWQRTLAKIGIAASIRSVDSAQYQQRLVTYDFDVILQSYPSSLSPGTEQIGRWGSASRDVDGTYNFAGVADPAVDALIGDLLRAKSQEEFVTAVRAYDRVLLSGAYVVPLYHQPEQWVARWRRVQHPEKTPIYGYQLPTWWARKPVQTSQ
jgi:peptide/nickel transport system substrate-binding protein